MPGIASNESADRTSWYQCDGFAVRVLVINKCKKDTQDLGFGRAILKFTVVTGSGNLLGYRLYAGFIR